MAECGVQREPSPHHERSERELRSKVEVESSDSDGNVIDDVAKLLKNGFRPTSPSALLQTSTPILGAAHWRHARPKSSGFERCREERGRTGLFLTKKRER